MTRFNHPLYLEDIQRLKDLPLDWDRLRGSTFLISGASGNIAGMFIDVLFALNLDINVIALGRNVDRAKNRFERYWEDEHFSFYAGDINYGISLDNKPANRVGSDNSTTNKMNPDDNGTKKAAGNDAGKINVDYIIHAASNTHPAAYSSDPIGTITTNIIGTWHLLEYGADCGCKRFVYASSVEIYGENRGDTDKFDEGYLGYIDCNTMRAGYPESKRAGEALCQAYIAQKGMDIVIPRLSRTYGPTLLDSDTKAISQFIHKGVKGEDIVLKSEGNQLYSYSYVADAASALFYCLLNGENGQAYNVADAASDKRLKDLAQTIADYSGTKVIFELPDSAEAAGYSTATTAVLDASKLEALGWKAGYTMEEGLRRTLTILRDRSA